MIKQIEYYDESFKAEAVKLALTSQMSYTEVARDLGVKYNTLTKWIYRVMKKPEAAPTIIKKADPMTKISKHDYQSLERELKAARKELELRKKEIEILKNAAAYFANMK